MSRRVAVRAIIEHDGKLLLVKLKAYSGALDGDYWCTIGGGLDPGESLEDGLVREVIEETAIKPDIGKLLYVQQFADSKNQEHLEFFFHVTNGADFTTIDLSKTSHGEEEIAELDFVDADKIHVLPKFLKAVQLPIDPNQSVQILNYL